MYRKTFAVSTLGCRINFYESSAIAEEFLRHGYEKAAFESAAVRLIHSCAVTAEAEKKGRALISRALKAKRTEGGIVCVFGCLAQKRREALYERYPDLDLVWGNADVGQVFALCDARLKGQSALKPTLPRLPKSYNTPAISEWYSPRAFVKIQDGCNSFCTYCIVPYLRGRERNRDRADILEEVRTLARGGVREIVLSGIETAAFGADALVELAHSIARVEGIGRIRFGSLKPSLFSADFCRRLAENEKIMPQFHLSVQSGASAVLSAMRRDYTREELFETVENLRAALPHVALTADLICGFPGETDADFEDTVSFVKAARLLHAHVFPYSEREGTRAASFPDQVPVVLRRERAAELGRVAEEVASAERERILPLEREILIERFRAGQALGHTEHFLELSLPRAAGDAIGSFKKIKE